MLHLALRYPLMHMGSRLQLDLRGNNIGPAGAAALALGLAANGSLTSLDLSSNQLCGLDLFERGTFTTEGITAIADALRVNGSLTKMRYVSPRANLTRVPLPCDTALCAFLCVPARCTCCKGALLPLISYHQTLPPAHCNLMTHSLCVRSLEGNRLDEQAKRALQNAWRGAPSHLEL